MASPFKATGEARLAGATVTFQPGARTHRHTHPLGQLLVVTEGEGWVQVEGEQVRTIKPGDVVWTAPGIKHWHGATAVSSMTHVAMAKQPVKVTLQRALVFNNTTHRPATIQRIRSRLPDRCPGGLMGIVSDKPYGRLTNY